MILSAFQTANNRAKQAIIVGSCITSAVAVGSALVRDQLPSPQSEDIHQRFQVVVFDDAFRQTVFARGQVNPADFPKGTLIHTYPSLKEVETHANAMIGNGVNLRMIKVNGYDEIGDEAPAVTKVVDELLPNGRAILKKDANGNYVEIASMDLGNEWHASDAKDYISEQRALYETFDAAAKKQPSLGEMTWDAVKTTASNAWQAARTVYNYTKPDWMP